MSGKNFLTGLKSGDTVAVALKGQETVWRKATVKHGHKHGSIVVDMGGREIEFGLDGVCPGNEYIPDKVLIPLTQQMLDEVRRQECIRELAAFPFDKFDLAELEPILQVLKQNLTLKEEAEKEPNGDQPQ